MHPDRKAFMEAIKAAPDDAPRLIFADWLAESGEEARAEFIREQCKNPMWFDDENWMAHVGPPPYPPEFVRCLDWLKSEEATADFGPPRDGRAWNRQDFHGIIGRYERGFIHYLTMSWEACCVRLDAIFDEHIIRKVTLTTEPPVDACDGDDGSDVVSLRGGPRYQWIPLKTIVFMDGGSTTAKLLSLEWPGIEFEWPEDEDESTEF